MSLLFYGRQYKTPALSDFELDMYGNKVVFAHSTPSHHNSCHIKDGQRDCSDLALCKTYS